MSSLVRILAVPLFAVGLVTIVAAPASASCVDTPIASAHAFTGTVQSVQLDGRLAQVKTDDGATVVVRGTPEGSTVSLTTVDRTYKVGARYEFHPINASSPYQDNACTATREIGGAGVPPRSDTSAASGSGLGWLLPAAFVTALLAAAGAMFWRIRRSRPIAARPTPPELS